MTPVRNLTAVVNSVAIQRKLNGRVIDEQWVRGLTGKFGADHFPSAFEGMIGWSGVEVK